MRRITVTIILALAILVLLVLAGRFGFTVVTIEDVEQTVQDEAFDPVAYVDGIWESRVLPTFNEEAVELSEVLNEMEPRCHWESGQGESDRSCQSIWINHCR